jgi:hypothetical protein
MNASNEEAMWDWRISSANHELFLWEVELIADEMIH